MEEAHVELNQLLSRDSDASPESLNRILLLLSQYPSFARSLGFEKGSPLFCLAGRSGVTLAAIQFAYSLYPGAIETLDIMDDWCPLHNACASTVPPFDVIEFLIQKYPEALKLTTGCDHDLPIHLAACNPRTPIATLQVLLDAYPDSLIFGNKEGEWPLDLALNHSCNPERIQFLADRHNQRPEHKLDRVRIGSAHARWPELFEVPRDHLTTCLSIVMPRVDRVVCGLGGFNVEHTEHAIALLEEATTTVRHLSLYLPGMAIHDNDEIWFRIAALICRNPHLRTIHLGLFIRDFHRKVNPPRYDHQNLCIALCGVITSISPDLHAFELESFSLADGGVAMTLLMLAMMDQGPLCRIKQLKLTKVKLSTLGEADEDGIPELILRPSYWRLCGAWRLCCLEKISILNCLMEADALLALLEELVLVRTLIDLQICFQSRYFSDEDMETNQVDVDEDIDPIFPDIEELNVTEAIAQILHQGRLQSLSIEGPVIDIDGIVEALSPNPDRMQEPAPLKKYHVPASLKSERNQQVFAELFPDNLSLEEVSFPDATDGSTRHKVQIAYHTTLNRLGIARLTSEHTEAQRAELVALLTEATKLPVRAVSGHLEQESVPASFGTTPLQYGILRFAPTLWSSP